MNDEILPRQNPASPGARGQDAAERLKLLSAVRRARKKREKAQIDLVESMRKAHEGGVSVANIMKAANVSRRTFYIWTREDDEENKTAGEV